jgi:uncharacterized protein YacL
VRILSILLFVLCGISGYYLAVGIHPDSRAGVAGLLAGILVAGLTLLVERALRRIPLRNLLGGCIGLLLGELVANLISNVFSSSLLNYERIALPLYGGLYGICGYIGIRIGIKKGEDVQLPGWKLLSRKPAQSEKPKILDTSVIIDGRIADVTETGFLDGPFLIPQFVLGELQHIADSSDAIKRTRGKRGLDVLHHIQKQAGIVVRVIDRDYPAIKEVDAKLIELAKELQGKIMTNDGNLNRVAQLQGIDVLNINELANSLKPVVLPGEEMTVKILKEGKEAGQGVAYLDDGTMIVVDSGRRHIGRSLDVIVTSVLQTPAGRMIFARLKEETGKEKTKETYYPMEEF